jgi:ribosomal protein L11 methyltransferase
VTANLRAPTLHGLKPVITAYLRDGGAIVLSGIKQNECADIKTSYEDACMSCRWEETEKDWAGLVFSQRRLYLDK